MKNIQIPHGLQYNFFLVTGEKFNFDVQDECKFYFQKSVPIKISKSKIRFRDSFPIIKINHMLFALCIKMYMIHYFLSTGKFIDRVRNFISFITKSSYYDLSEFEYFKEYSKPQQVQILHDYYLFRFGGVSLMRDYYPYLINNKELTVGEIFDKFNKLINQHLETKLGVANVKML